MVELDALYRLSIQLGNDNWDDVSSLKGTIESLNQISDQFGNITPIEFAKNKIRYTIDRILGEKFDTDLYVGHKEPWTEETYNVYCEKRFKQFGHAPGFIKQKVLEYLEENNHEKYLSFIDLTQFIEIYFKRPPPLGLLLFQEKSPNILLFSQQRFTSFIAYFDNSKYYLAKLSHSNDDHQYSVSILPDQPSGVDQHITTSMTNLIQPLYDVTRSKYKSDIQLRDEEVALIKELCTNGKSHLDSLINYFITNKDHNLENYKMDHPTPFVKYLMTPENRNTINNKTIEQHFGLLKTKIDRRDQLSNSGSAFTNLPFSDIHKPLLLHIYSDYFGKALEIIIKIQHCLIGLNNSEQRTNFFNSVKTDILPATHKLIESRMRYQQIEKELKKIPSEHISLLRPMLLNQNRLLKLYSEQKMDFEKKLYTIKRQYLGESTPQIFSLEETTNHFGAIQEQPIIPTPLQLNQEQKTELEKFFNELHAEFMSPGSIQEIEKKLAELDSQEAIQQITLPASKSGIGAATSKIMSFIYVVTKLYFLRFGLGFAKIFLSWRIFLPLLFLLITGLIPKDNLQGIKKALVSFLKILCYASSRVLNSVYNFFSTGKEEDKQKGGPDAVALSSENVEQSTPSSKNYGQSTHVNLPKRNVNLLKRNVFRPDPRKFPKGREKFLKRYLK